MIVGYVRHILGRGDFLVPPIREQPPKKGPSLKKGYDCINLFKQHFVNSHGYSKAIIKFRSKFQFQILLQFYRTAEKVTKIKLVMVIVTF